MNEDRKIKKYRKLTETEIFKISINRIAEDDNLKITKEEAARKGEIVSIQNNQLLHLLGCGKFTDDIVNVYVPQDDGKKGEKLYKQIGMKGFNLNGYHYVRLFSGSGQIRRNTITFIKESLYQKVIDKCLCGLTFADFGKFNSAKYNAYGGLAMSGCHLLPEKLAPCVCVIDDYEVIKPHEQVNHVTESKVDYLTLEEKDYILKDNDPAFTRNGKYAIRKYDGVAFKIRKGVHKEIHAEWYDEIDNAPAINSFDGQGIMSPEWAQGVADEIGYDFEISQYIIRAPWIKGLLYTFDFKAWMREHGIEEITDIFGVTRKIDDLDVILSKSQFKMAKVYKAKYGSDAWQKYNEARTDSGLLWGIVKPNKRKDDNKKYFNYQYLQALLISNEDAEKLCKETEDFLMDVNSSDIKKVVELLSVNLDEEIEMENSDDEKYEPRWSMALKANPDLINDKYIRELIIQECKGRMKKAKLGKIIVNGNFQYGISDPIAQMQFIAKYHGNADIDVVGVVPSGNIYSSYWLKQENHDEVVVMRNPCIDRNELAKRKVMDETDDTAKWFRYLHSGIILSIHDLTALGCGGADFDGDIFFTTNNNIVKNGVYEYGDAKPLYYSLGKATDKPINLKNIVNADVRGLNSRVGQISNKGTVFYDMLTRYNAGSDEYNKLYDNVVMLGQIVGQEIDRIKTGIAPTEPYSFTRLSRGKNDVLTKQDEQGMKRHNRLAPDKKPYFFRYNYDHVDKELRKVIARYNQECRFHFWLSLDEVIEKVDSRNATDEMVELVKNFRKEAPVSFNECLTTHISHHFEDKENTIKKRKDECANLIGDLYHKEIEYDPDKLKQIKTIIDDCLIIKRERTKALNMDGTMNNHELTQSNHDFYKALYDDAKEKAFAICGTRQETFDYLYKASGSSNIAMVWNIMDAGQYKDMMHILGGNEE